MCRIPGDRRLYALNNEVSCGACQYCESGLSSHCMAMYELGINRDGGYAERIVAPRQNLSPLGAGIGIAGVLTEPLACALHDLARLGAAAQLLGGTRPRALVIGGGVSGALLSYLMARDRSLTLDIVLYDISEAPLAWTHDCQVERVPEIEPASADLVIECSGSVSGLNAAIRAVTNGGIVFIYGVPSRGTCLPANASELFRRELSVVTVRVMRCFFCAMHARAVRVGHAQHTGPKVFGRMLAGVIDEKGKNLEAFPLPVGARVTVNPERPCGDCFYCRVEEPGHCTRPTVLASGGMAEYVRVPAPLVGQIFALADDVSFEHGAFAETLAGVLRGLDLSNIRVGDTVVVIGAGGVGLSFLQLALRCGAARIIVAGRQTSSLECALRLGAHITVDVRTERLEDAVREVTGGFGADVVIEAVGSVETYDQSLRLLRFGGIAVGFGGLAPNSRFSVDPNAIHYGSLTLVGSYRYHPVHFRRALDLIRAQVIDLDSIVTHHLAFDRLIEGKVDLHAHPDCRALVIDVAH